MVTLKNTSSTKKNGIDMRVTTQLKRRVFKFILDDGTSIEHAPSFEFNGQPYFFFGNVFYDLDDELVNHIFGR